MFTKKTTLVIPTKNRYALLVKTLQNLKSLKVKFNEIIVVDSSNTITHNKIKKISKKFSLKIYQSKPSSSLQRNIGIKKMNKKNKYLMLLDDDIIFHKNSFNNMNNNITSKKNKKIIGFAFCQKSKIENNFFEKLKNSKFSQILGLYSPKPGVVLRSGWHTKIYQKNKNYFTDWLPTAATIFEKKYVTNLFDINFGQYSYLEDLDFSVRLKKHYNFLVVSNALFTHKDVKIRNNFSFGYYEIINRCRFVKKNKLNFSHFYYISFIKIIINILGILIRPNSVQKTLGNILGLFFTIKIIFSAK